ncbi:MAG TPA: aspartyl protease family protein [Pirellulales bacterium]|nr:aspartyl protease family protein [Pirellulales bacterium]
MGIDTMGRVTVTALIENLEDLTLADNGKLAGADIRRIEVSDALVDTGASTLSMPISMIQKLGLKLHRKRRTMTAGGAREIGVFSGVRVTIQDRDCIVEVNELPDGCPVLIGQIPLEAMDWVVDPNRQRLIGNPAHGGVWTTEQY